MNPSHTHTHTHAHMSLTRKPPPSHKFDAHSPNNYVTKAQGSAVFQINGQTVWLGNQWNSGLSQSPPGPRNHDLLYWAVLPFKADGSVAQLEYASNVTITTLGKVL